MHLKLKLLLAFVFCFVFVKGQDISTLRSKAKTASGAELADLYLETGKIFYEKNSRADSLLYYAQLAYDLSLKSKHESGRKRSLLAIGLAYQKLMYFDTTNIILTKLLPELNSQNDADILGEVYSTLGVNCYRVNDNKGALDNYLKSVKAFETTKNNDGLAIVNSRISVIFNNETQYDQALEYAQKTAKLIPAMKAPFAKSTVLSNLASIYIQIGISKKIYLDTSIAYSKKSLSYAIEYGFYPKVSQLCNLISNAYYLKHDSISALAYSKESLKFRAYLLPTEILATYANLSDCYNRMRQHSNALIYLDSMKQIVPFTNDPYYQMSLFERVYNYNKDAGNLNEALYGLERFKTIQDSLYSTEKSSAINELMQKYNKSENEKEINELNRKNEISSLNVKILVVGILAAVLIIVVIIFFYRQSVLKNKFKVLETEQRLNRARMDPHFFFNALTSIQTLSMDEEDNKKVPSLIAKFSKIMRQSLESSYDELTTIEEEVSFLTNYLDLQKIRYSNKFDYEIKVDESLEQDELKIPGMLLQPLIENSIEHGFKNMNHKGILKINFIKEPNHLKVELRDNGVGFNTEPTHKGYPSRATQIISDRLILLNKKHKSHASYKLSKNPEGKGILVEVTIPFIS